MVFNLRNHNLEFVIKVPNEVLKQNSLLTNFVIDEESPQACRDVYLYISDTAEPGINYNCNYFGSWSLF